MGILVLAKFDPGANYVARKPMVVDGQQVAPGDPLPVGVNPRRLRQLYEARLLMKAVEEPVVEEPVVEESVVEEPVVGELLTRRAGSAPPAIPVPVKLKSR